MGDGFFSELFTHVGQWGTHVDPSAHFHKGLRTVDQIELKEMDPAARVHRRSGRATICLPLLPEDQIVLNAMLAKTVGVWMRPSAVVENMLGQLTESRGRNEDRL